LIGNPNRGRCRIPFMYRRLLLMFLPLVPFVLAGCGKGKY
jgi:hypothetical protein